MDEDALFQAALQTRNFRYTGVTQATDGQVVATAIRDLDRHVVQHIGANERLAKRMLARLVVRPAGRQ